MRHAGKLTDWNDDRGFGFVTPNGGGPRAFVHVKAFQAGSRRPVEGDLISYQTVTDGKGRLNATGVRFAGQRITPPQRGRSAPRPRGADAPRMRIAWGFLLALAVLVALDRVPLVLGFAYVVLGLVSWLLYCLDKAAAERGARRIPESTLHLVDLLGGWPGGLIAQQQFRHKTVKRSFQAMFWCTVLVNVVVLGWLAASGEAGEFVRAIVGG